MKLAAVVLLALSGCVASNGRSSRETGGEAPKASSVDTRSDTGRDGDEDRSEGDGRAGREALPGQPTRNGNDPSAASDSEKSLEVVIPRPVTGSGGSASTGADPATEGDCYRASVQVCAAEREIFRLVNQLRVKEGKPALAFSSRLAFVSRDWSAEQASRGEIGHDGFPGRRNAKYRQEFPGSRPRIRAENVGVSEIDGPEQAARNLFQMWADSPGHRKNMLGSFRVFGVGIAEGKRGWYGTQIFGEADE